MDAPRAQFGIDVLLNGYWSFINFNDDEGSRDEYLMLLPRVNMQLFVCLFASRAHRKDESTSVMNFDVFFARFLFIELILDDDDKKIMRRKNSTEFS
jgi:hypothetical protein